MTAIDTVLAALQPFWLSAWTVKANLPAVVGANSVTAPLALLKPADGDHAKLLNEPDAVSEAVSVRLCAP